MNERIILKFLEFGQEKAQRMLSAAADFASSKPDGPVGWRAGTVYSGRYGTFLARWTATRTVVVEELEPKEEPTTAVGGWAEYVCNQCGELYGETTDPRFEECGCGGNYVPPKEAAGG